jgi:hypothetical protein
MTPDQWPTALTARIAQGIREARRAADLTMAEVAHGCADEPVSSGRPTLYAPLPRYLADEAGGRTDQPQITSKRSGQDMKGSTFRR